MVVLIPYEFTLLIWFTYMVTYMVVLIPYEFMDFDSGNY